MPKLRIIPWLFGVALVLTSLAGANCLMNASDASSSGSAPPALPKPANGSEGLIAKGTVYSDPMTFPVTLPSRLAAGEVAKVHVKSGQTVNANEPLISFEDKHFKKDFEKAQRAYEMAANDWSQAEHNLKTTYPNLIEGANLALTRAKSEHDTAKETSKLARQEKQKTFAQWRDPNSGRPYTLEELEQRLNEDFQLFNLRGLVTAAELQVSKASNDLQKAQNSKTEFEGTVNHALIKAQAMKLEMERAEQAVKDCVVTAKLPGTIEQVSAAEGQTVYPQSKPLLFFVPAGPRMVHAEIVPDFAHRIKDRVGKEVQITDDSNTHLVYKGIVKRVPEAFLPKPSGAPDIINGKSNLVLIVEIEVVDAHPKDLPPLRVGQPVRVIFP